MTSSVRSEAVVIFNGGSSMLAIAAVAVANAMWGASIVAGQAALTDLPPLALGCLRSGVAFAVLLTILIWTGRRPAWGRGPALLGLTGVALFFSCYNTGLGSTSATHATLVLDGGEPVLTALLAAGFLGERLTGRRLLGLGTALAGVTIVVFSNGGGLGGNTYGDVLVLASALCWAAYSVIGRRVFATGDLLAVVTGAAGYGALFLLPIALIEVAAVGASTPSAGGLLTLLYLGAGCSGLAYVLIGVGLRRLEVTQVGALGNLSPITGLAAAALVAGEPLGVQPLAGAALVLAGIWVAARPPNHGDVEAARADLATETA